MLYGGVMGSGENTEEKAPEPAGRAVHSFSAKKPVYRKKTLSEHFTALVSKPLTRVAGQAVRKPG